MSRTIHPRHFPVEKAYLDIDSAVSEAMQKHPDLTYMELLSILTRITASWAKYGIRDERKEDIWLNGTSAGSAAVSSCLPNATIQDSGQ